MKTRYASNREDFSWPDGKRVAVSLSFDDARPSQLDAGIPILNRHGVKGTFYLSPANIGERREDWARAAEDGHELGNHSLRHSCSGNFGWKGRTPLESYTLEQMAAELLEANQTLTDLFGIVPKTFAYPCGQTFVGRGVDRRSYVPIVAENFLAGRGFRDEYFNNPTFCDMAKLGGTELDGVSFEGLVAITEKAASRGAWVAFAGHDVKESSSHQVVPTDVLDRYCAWCQDPANGIWIDTVAAVADYVDARRVDQR